MTNLRMIARRLFGAITVPPISERFFYHSFPRRGKKSDNEIPLGCKILSSIRDCGFLLTPEIVSWSHPHADGSPPRMQNLMQRRVCFTELSPVELPRHANEFGHFALEFPIDTLKSLGAFPVFYIPQATATAGKGVSLGPTLVVQVIDAMLLAMRLVEIKKKLNIFPPITNERIDCGLGFQNQEVFHLDVTEIRRTFEALTRGLTPPDMLEHALVGLLNLFYPADDVQRDSPLKYYRQREWRIASNFGVTVEGVMRLPSVELVNRLIEIDSDFFGKQFPPKKFEESSVIKRLADYCYVYPVADGKRMIELASRVIVPAKAVEQARTILKALSHPPPVTSLEGIAHYEDPAPV